MSQSPIDIWRCNHSNLKGALNLYMLKYFQSDLANVFEDVSVVEVNRRTSDQHFNGNIKMLEEIKRRKTTQKKLMN